MALQLMLMVSPYICMRIVVVARSHNIYGGEYPTQ